ncbi:MAG TPA: S1/P1 nuclease [Thermoanaerobaculia bacterium]|nr:S1/P1 nuclease [Thermoanaerobaculia bacterium]
MRRFASITVLAAALLASFLPSWPAYGWGNRGHELICEMAFQELSDAARREVKRLIRLDPEFGTFARSCTWPDHEPKKRPDEHYVNLPRDAERVESANCGEAPRCVLSALADDADQLSRTTSDRRKLELIKYLGHWVGDVHQPFHVSFADDRGGGRIHELGDACRGEQTLHRVWDVCLVEEGVLEGGVRQTARRLLAGVSREERRRWRRSTPVEWADESFQIVRREEVGYCTLAEDGCRYETHAPRAPERGALRPERGFLVDDTYLELHAPVAKERIQQAAVRLAAMLDRLLNSR